MTRRDFYKIRQEHYLLPNQVGSAETRARPEEAIRQWCAHELIRAYGFSIENLSFEAPVRVGSKVYRIDIQVSLQGRPRIVVECKERSYKSHEKAVEQAISYANAEEVKAEFVIYTNGDVWQVRRRLADRWISVTDIPSHFSEVPNRTSGPSGESFEEMLRMLKYLSPILYNHGQKLQGREAGCYLHALQRFFNGANLLTYSVNDHLRAATDNLLRVLSSADDHLSYRGGKLVAAMGHFDDYWREAGYPHEILPIEPGLGIRGHMRRLHCLLWATLDHGKKGSGWDDLVLKINLALSDYGTHQSAEEYPAVAQEIYDPVLTFVEFALLMRLNTRMPESCDRPDLESIREYCRPFWEEWKREQEISWREFLSAWTSVVVARLCFWRKERV